jgi:hypothetical protein
MASEWARAPRGQRAHANKPCRWGDNVSLVGALGTDGLRTMMTLNGAVDADAFVAFVEHFIVPKLARVTSSSGTGAQGSQSPCRHRAGRRRTLFPAALLAGLQPHRAVLEQAQSTPPPSCCSHQRHPRRRGGVSHDCRLSSRRPRLVHLHRLSTSTGLITALTGGSPHDGRPRRRA